MTEYLGVNARTGDHWRLVIDFLALAFDPDTDLDDASADAIDVLAGYGCETEDDEPNGDDDCSVEDEVDTIIRRNRLAKAGWFRGLANHTIDDFGMDPDVEYDDWDSSRSDDGPEETPVVMFHTERQVRLFTARERSEERKAERNLQRVPSWNLTRFCWRSNIIGSIAGRPVRYYDLGRHVQKIRNSNCRDW